MTELSSIEFAVKGLPPKKDGATSMWGKTTELERIQRLRTAARKALGAAGPFRRNITLAIAVYASAKELPRVGDLDNFITGVCDGLMMAAGVHRDVRWEGDGWDGIQPCDAVGIQDDAHVVSIVARKMSDECGEPWYKVVLAGER